MKGFIINNSNFDHRKKTGESSSLPSCAVPNESYTIQDLLRRNTNGQALPDIGRAVGYPDHVSHDSIDFEQFKNSDLVDQEEQAERVSQIIARGNDFINKKTKAEKAKAKAEADELNEVKAELLRQRANRSKKVGNGKKGTTDEHLQEGEN